MSGFGGQFDGGYETVDFQGEIYDDGEPVRPPQQESLDYNSLMSSMTRNQPAQPSMRQMPQQNQMSQQHMGQQHMGQQNPQGYQMGNGGYAPAMQAQHGQNQMNPMSQGMGYQYDPNVGTGGPAGAADFDNSKFNQQFEMAQQQKRMQQEYAQYQQQLAMQQRQLAMQQQQMAQQRQQQQGAGVASSGQETFMLPEVGQRPLEALLGKLEQKHFLLLGVLAVLVFGPFQNRLTPFVPENLKYGRNRLLLNAALVSVLFFALSKVWSTIVPNVPK